MGRYFTLIMSLTQEEKKQYSRHLILENVGLKGQQYLKNAKVKKKVNNNRYLKMQKSTSEVKKKQNH